VTNLNCWVWFHLCFLVKNPHFFQLAAISWLWVLVPANDLSTRQVPALLLLLSSLEPGHCDGSLLRVKHLILDISHSSVTQSRPLSFTRPAYQQWPDHYRIQILQTTWDAVSVSGPVFLLRRSANCRCSSGTLKTPLNVWSFDIFTVIASHCWTPF
jgi:hypothetical protein